MRPLLLRITAIEREYSAKLDDLRRNYALRVTIAWAQGLELFVQVQRFEVLVKRRKGERPIRIDWHPTVRLMEPPPSDWGLGLERSRLVCDDHLHITEVFGSQSGLSCCLSLWPRLLLIFISSEAATALEKGSPRLPPTRHIIHPPAQQTPVRNGYRMMARVAVVGGGQSALEAAAFAVAR